MPQHRSGGRQREKKEGRQRNGGWLLGPPPIPHLPHKNGLLKYQKVERKICGVLQRFVPTTKMVFGPASEIPCDFGKIRTSRLQKKQLIK